MSDQSHSAPEQSQQQASATPQAAAPTTMLGALGSGLGAGLLQRKLARRAAARSGGAAGSEGTGEGAGEGAIGGQAASRSRAKAGSTRKSPPAAGPSTSATPQPGSKPPGPQPAGAQAGSQQQMQTQQQQQQQQMQTQQQLQDQSSRQQQQVANARGEGQTVGGAESHADADAAGHGEVEASAAGQGQASGEGEAAGAGASGFGLSDVVDWASGVISDVGAWLGVGAPTVSHQTNDQAPDGTANDRTKVGVGEWITFRSSAAGTWSADHAKGGSATTGSGTTYQWFAPSTAATCKISFDPGGGASKIDTTINVIAPTVEYLNARPLPFDGQAPGMSGAQMETDVVYKPLDVSFVNTTWWEQPGPASGASGYFAGKPLPFHNPNPDDLPIDGSNSGITDAAGFWDWGAPWSDGDFEWAIPTKYTASGESTRHLITTVHQTCHIDATGTITVKKAPSSITRSP